MREKLTIPNVSVPEELVQVQAYLRWERNGKQMYTPEKEKASVKHRLVYRDKLFVLLSYSPLILHLCSHV